MANFRVTNPGGLNIRSGPGAEWEDIGDLAYGELVESVDTKGWIPIVVDDLDEEEPQSVAWASAKYLAETVEEPETVPQPIKGVTGKHIVAKAMTQQGDPYIFGYEVDLNDPNPDAFDCSELVQWTCAQLKVVPTMPDGAANQYDHCRKYGTLTSIAQAVHTPGALLFRIGGSYNHVVISRGDGSTIEAKGSAYGVGVFALKTSNFTHAAFIPGVSYA